MFLRDNLLETEAAKASEAGQLLVTAGKNLIGMYKPVSSTVANTNATSSTTPVNLAGGPSVTVTHSGAMLVLFSARGWISAGGTGPSNIIRCGPSVDGESGAQALMGRAIYFTTNAYCRYAGHVLHYNLTPGTSTVRLQYWTNGGGITGSFAQRNLTVIPL